MTFGFSIVAMTKFRNDNRIVIVGGGCVGLSTAYHLAKMTISSSPKTQIMVIEACEKPFAAASSACTGCLHYSFPEPLNEPLLPLGKYSFDLWPAEAAKADFQAATGYRAKSLFGIAQGTAKDLAGFQTGCTKNPPGTLTLIFWGLITLRCEYWPYRIVLELIRTITKESPRYWQVAYPAMSGHGCSDSIWSDGSGCQLIS